MGFDIRWPLGAFFALLGALLALYGGVAGARLGTRTFGIDVDLWWGLVLLLFGVVILLGAARSGRRQNPQR
jgi:hypothetical protein